MIKTRIGDLVKEAYSFDVIIHGCNCYNTMGAGIAAAIKSRWPGVYDADTEAYKLGTVKLGNISVYRDDKLTILNCYTQFGTAGARDGARNLNYEALYLCLQKVNRVCKGLKVGIPLIGCGLAGGNWKIVKVMMEEVLVDCDATVVYLESDKLIVES